MLSLTGLISGGSIPLHVLCLGGLLTFLALWGSAYVDVLSTSRGKENHMNKGKARETAKTTRVVTALAKTTWAIGTSAWAGALSG